MPCSDAVKSGEAVEGDEADEGLPVDSDASVSMSSLSRQYDVIRHIALLVYVLLTSIKRAVSCDSTLWWAYKVRRLAVTSTRTLSK